MGYRLSLSNLTKEILPNLNLSNLQPELNKVRLGQVRVRLG